MDELRWKDSNPGRVASMLGLVYLFVCSLAGYDPRATLAMLDGVKEEHFGRWREEMRRAGVS